MDLEKIEGSSSKNNKPNSTNEILHKSKPLKGKDLLKFVEKHREQYLNNGDSICIEAGYGGYTEEGTEKCRLEVFSAELIKANKDLHQTSIKTRARQEILSTYDIETLKLISELGCISGKAHSHLQISENEKFFDQNEKEITISLIDQFGKDYLIQSAERVGGRKSHWKHRAVWRFIEMIAHEELDKLTNNEQTSKQRT